MSAVDSPAMNEVGTLSEQDVESDFSRYSKLTGVALVMAVVSLLSAVSSLFIPLTILAILISLVALWRISRDTTLGGAGIAQLALGIATLAFGWSVTSTYSRYGYFYETAGNHAEVFLKTLASGDTYGACELMKPEQLRQITGTDLKAIYENQAMDDYRSHELLLEEPATDIVLESGPNADWKFSRGVQVLEKHPYTIVSVEMANAANPDTPKVYVTLRREVERYPQPDQEKVAIWKVDSSVIMDD